MNVLIDTSIWIDILKDKSGAKRTQLENITLGFKVNLCRFTQLELLQGAKNEKEWKLLQHYLEFQSYLETTEQMWVESAKIYFDIRRKGKTVRSPIDCCIAQIAIENKALLLHRDQDFNIISQQRNIQQQFINWDID